MKIAQSLAADGSGSTQALRRYRTYRFLYRRRAGRHGSDVTLFASGDSMTNAGSRRSGRAPCASTRRCAITWRRISSCSSRSRRARRGIRHHPLPHGLSRLPDFPAHRRAVRDDPARAARPARVGTALQQLPDDARWSRSRMRSASRCRMRNLIATVHHGIPTRLLTPRPAPAAISLSSAASRRRRRPTRAIGIAAAAGMTLKIAAKVDRRRPGIFRRRASRRCSSHPTSSSSARSATPRRAPSSATPPALLFPIDWPRALRPGDDRGDGLRHAGDRLPPRLGARGHR